MELLAEVVSLDSTLWLTKMTVPGSEFWTLGFFINNDLIKN